MIYKKPKNKFRNCCKIYCATTTKLIKRPTKLIKTLSKFMVIPYYWNITDQYLCNKIFKLKFSPVEYIRKEGQHS